MNDKPLVRLGALGQSIWLDDIRQDLIASGGLRCLIEEDGLRGMTSNPAIFEHAIVESHGYDDDIRALAGKQIGPDMVTTVPLATLAAYRDHGKPRARLAEDVMEAQWLLERLAEIGVDLDRATQQLEDEGVQKFNGPFDQLLETLAQRSSPPGRTP